MTKYVWRCGNRYATIEMHVSEMDRIKDDAFALANFQEEVDTFLGHEHPHIFKQVVRPKSKGFRLRSEIDQDPVVFVCEKWNIPKTEKFVYVR